jgi:hypothetical protein
VLVGGSQRRGGQEQQEQDEEGVMMTGTGHGAPARRAREAAAPVRRLVEEAGKDGDLRMLDGLLPRAGASARPGGICVGGSCWGRSGGVLSGRLVTDHEKADNIGR